MKEFRKSFIFDEVTGKNIYIGSFKSFFDSQCIMSVSSTQGGRNYVRSSVLDLSESAVTGGRSAYDVGRCNVLLFDGRRRARDTLAPLRAGLGAASLLTTAYDSPTRRAAVPTTRRCIARQSSSVADQISRRSV